MVSHPAPAVQVREAGRPDSHQRGWPGRRPAPPPLGSTVSLQSTGEAGMGPGPRRTLMWPRPARGSCTRRWLWLSTVEREPGGLGPHQAGAGSAGAVAVRCPQHLSLSCPSGSLGTRSSRERRDGLVPLGQYPPSRASVGTESQGPLRGHPRADTGTPPHFRPSLHCLCAPSPDIQPQGPPRRASARPVGLGSEFFPERTREPSTSRAPLHPASSCCSRPSLTPPPRVGCVPPSHPLPPRGGRAGRAARPEPPHPPPACARTLGPGGARAARVHSHVLLAQQLAPDLHHEAVEVLVLGGPGR